MITANNKISYFGFDFIWKFLIRNPFECMVLTFLRVFWRVSYLNVFPKKGPLINGLNLIVRSKEGLLEKNYEKITLSR